MNSSRAKGVVAALLVVVVAVGLVAYAEHVKKSRYVRVPALEEQLQHYASRMQTMGVKHIAMHGNPLFRQNYSSLLAYKGGGFYEELYLEGVSQQLHPRLTSGWKYYLAKVAYFPMKIFPVLDFEGFVAAKMTLDDKGGLVVTVNRMVLKNVPPQVVGSVMTDTADFHLRRLAVAQKLAAI